MTKDLCPKIPHACLLNVVAKTLKWWEDGLRVTRQGSESYCTVGMIVSCWTPCLSSENSGHQDLGWNPKGKAPIHQIYHLTWFCLSHKVHIACTLLPPMMWVADKHKTDQIHFTKQKIFKPDKCASSLCVHHQAECQTIHSLRNENSKFQDIPAKTPLQ
jgi:hypothetical protein